MCGIVGYVGRQQAPPLLLEGLRRLEYRGYDSAGIAVLHDGTIQTRKKKGKIDEGLARLMAEAPLEGVVGLGHTRWATHGPPSDENSHPHLDQSRAHRRGPQRRHRELRAPQGAPASRPHVPSATDTEVLAHLIGDHYERLEAEPTAARRDDLHPLAQAVDATPCAKSSAPTASP